MSHVAAEKRVRKVGTHQITLEKPNKRDEAGKPGLAKARLAAEYRAAMGLSEETVGAISTATPAQLLARVIEPSHPVDALHAVHQDGMALTRLLAADDGHLDSTDRRDVANALWRVFNRMEIVTELVERASWRVAGRMPAP